MYLWISAIISCSIALGRGYATGSSGVVLVAMFGLIVSVAMTVDAYEYRQRAIRAAMERHPAGSQR